MADGDRSHLRYAVFLQFFFFVSPTANKRKNKENYSDIYIV